MESSIHDKDSPGRPFLKIATAGMTGLGTTVGVKFVSPDPVLAQSKLSPDTALQKLTDGNRRFTADRLTACEQDLAILKQNTAENQEPFAAVLSCADSRVPVELIFDQSIGHIFVSRVAGNIVTQGLSRALNTERLC